MVSEYGILVDDTLTECVIDDYTCTFLNLDDAIELVAKELVGNG